MVCMIDNWIARLGWHNARVDFGRAKCVTLPDRATPCQTSCRFSSGRTRCGAHIDLLGVRRIGGGGTWVGHGRTLYVVGPPAALVHQVHRSRLSGFPRVVRAKCSVLYWQIERESFILLRW
jgi:hypothetical protein